MEAMSRAISRVLADCDQAQSIALALVVGQRAFAAAFRGARCWRFGELGGEASAEARDSKVLCHDFEKSGAAYVVLSMGDLGLKASEIREVVLPHLTQARPRAASLSLRQAAQGVGIGCMRLAASGGPAGPATSVPGQPAKRQRVVGVDAREVPGRRMLQVLDELSKEGGATLAKAFTAACRTTSECQSSLQGGELAGDLGWLDKDKGIDAQRANAKMVRPAVPAPVLRTAFDLEVGEMSDLVSSEVGVHLLLRSA
eukprot:g1949.t1